MTEAADLVTKPLSKNTNGLKNAPKQQAGTAQTGGSMAYCRNNKKKMNRT